MPSSIEEQVRQANEAADRYEAEGDLAMASMMRVEADNIIYRGENWQPVHCPSLGPYNANNPCVCTNCGTPIEAWSSTEEKCPGKREPIAN